ncbi:hypothetical protein ACRS6B_20915 [Nocardia asteroides]
MSPFPVRDDAGHTEQDVLAYHADHDFGLDTTALTPLAERVRAAFDSAGIADRIDQSLLTPLPDEDYPLAY